MLYIYLYEFNFFLESVQQCERGDAQLFVLYSAAMQISIFFLHVWTHFLLPEVYILGKVRIFSLWKRGRHGARVALLHIILTILLFLDMEDSLSVRKITPEYYTIL